MIEIENKT